MLKSHRVHVRLTKNSMPKEKGENKREGSYAYKLEENYQVMRNLITEIKLTST